MTTNEQLLKALRLACAWIMSGKEVMGCDEMGCKYYPNMNHDKCDHDGCQDALEDYFIGQAKGKPE